MYQFLSSCDYVIYIPGGGHAPVCGNHQQLMEMSGGEYSAFIGDVSQQQQQHPKQRTVPRQHTGQ